MSGTTRDAVDTEVVDVEGNKFNLIDTAGIRKRSAVTDSADGAEPLSVQRAIQAVRRAQVQFLNLFSMRFHYTLICRGKQVSFAAGTLPISYRAKVLKFNLEIEPSLKGGNEFLTNRKGFQFAGHLSQRKH